MNKRSRTSLFAQAICLYLLFCLAAANAAPAVSLPTTKIAALALPAVVSITARNKRGDQVKSGSGFVIGPGMVATNRHVVLGARLVTISFSDGRSVSSTGFFAERSRYDLAIISCDTGTIVPLQLEPSPSIEIGENVVAVGSPEGFSGSVSTGIVSGMRVLPDHGGARVYQTTAPISHGSSGGPLLNAQAKVIGMNSFYYAGGQNLNFAYSAEYAAGLRSSIAKAPKPVTKWDATDSLLDSSAKLQSTEIERRLDRGADIDERDKDGNTALIKSASDNPECVRALIAAGADVNATDDDGRTALMGAFNNLDCANALIAAGADVNAKTKHGGTALLSASMFGTLECLKALVAAGAIVNVSDSYKKWTPLTYAAIQGEADMVKVLIAAGANVNARDREGDTALMHACLGGKGNINVVKALIESRADVTAKDSNDMTALKFALSSPDIADILRAAGATE